jgi:hypothetical protein
MSGMEFAPGQLAEYPLELELPRPRLGAAVRLRAHLRGPWLDRQFASGVQSWASPSHAARALQLTNPRRRRFLARSLERLVEEAARPPLPARAASIRVCRSEVKEAREEVVAIVARLREPDPVDAHGIAALLELLRDGCGPVYVPLRPGALRSALQMVLDGLEPPGV